LLDGGGRRFMTNPCSSRERKTYYPIKKTTENEAETETVCASISTTFTYQCFFLRHPD
jgi:hypothetical protein